MDHRTLIEQEQNIDLKKLFFMLWNHWYLFVISIGIALGCAFLFSKFANPVYKVTTSLLIEEEKGIDPQNIIGFGLISDHKNLENEICILKSNSLIKRTLKNLDFSVSYFYQNNFTQKELDYNSPIIVEFDKNHPQLIQTKFKIEILSDTQYKLSIKGQNKKSYLFSKHQFVKNHNSFEHSGIYNFGEYISNSLYKLKISLNKNANLETKQTNDLYFVFNDLNSLLGKYRNVSIEPLNRNSSVVSISLKGENAHKSVTFLNQLTQEYIDKGLERKNEVATRTIEFITHELEGISDSLIVTENSLQNYRADNHIMNVDFQSQQVFEYIKDLENEKAILLVKSKYYKNLKDYLQKRTSSDDIVVPSSLGIDEPLLNILVSKLINLFEDRNDLLFSVTESNPMVTSIDNQIQRTKKALIENINNVSKTSTIAINDINGRIAELEKKITNLPKNQRELISIERKFKLNDATYTFLLQKLSEAKITKASNHPDNEVIDHASLSNYSQIFPKIKLNYMIAILLALIIPTAYIFAKDYFNGKIASREEVENLTKLPIIGNILHNKKDTNLVIFNGLNSPIAESFRSLRTNIQFLVTGKEKHIVLVTSDIPKSGKTFVSMNLASVFSQYNKKTLLLGFDLRNPRIYQDFKLQNDRGLSTYYLKKHGIDEIIQSSSFSSNLDVITAGVQPPNPAELIASPATKVLFDELSQKYDYIIVDTPPLGLVTDSFLLMKYTDANLFVVRQNHTKKRFLMATLNDIESKRLSGISILINDIKPEQNSYYYNYDYQAEYALG